MRRALKRLARISSVAAVCLLALAGAVWVAGNTHAGRGLIERLTYSLSAGYVHLSGLGGSFPARLTVDELTLNDGHGVWLTADHVALLWSPLKLLERLISVDRLQAARVHMERAPRGSGKSGGSVFIPHVDVGQFDLAVVELGAPLAGTPATFSASGMLQLRSLDDARVDLTAHRQKDPGQAGAGQGGAGDYTLHLSLDPERMDASLDVHEPAGGPLQNLLSLPGLGALTAAMTVRGPRAAERVDAVVDAGTLHAQVHGSVDLSLESADLDYSLQAPAMAPRPDLAWRSVQLDGNWHGPWASPRAEGQLAVEELRIAGTTRLPRVQAHLAASDGRLAVHSTVSGLEIPGPQPRVFADGVLTLDAGVVLSEAALPVEVTASHPLFTLHARVDTAARSAAERHATVQLSLPDVAPLAAIAGEDVRGVARINARLNEAPRESTLQLDADLGVTGGAAAAAWVPILGPHAALAVSASLADDSVGIQSLRLTGDAVTLTASGSAARVPAAGSAAASIQDLHARWQLDAVNLAKLSKDFAGDLTVSGQLAGSPSSLSADAVATSRLSVRGSAMGAVQATVHAHGLPKAPSVSLDVHGMIDGAPLNVDAVLDRSADRVVRIAIRQAGWKSAHIDGDMAADAQFADSHGALHVSVGQLSDFDRLAGMTLGGSLDGSLGFMPSHGHTEAHLELNGTNLAAGPFSGDVHVQAQGAANAVDLQLTAQSPALYGKPARAAAAAVLNIDARRLRLASLSVGYRGATLSLLSAAELSFGAGLSVDDLKLGADNAVLEMSGRVSPALDLQASLTHVDPALVNRFMLAQLAGGSISARADLKGSPSSPTGTVRLDASDLRFSDDAATGLPALEIHATAQLADAAATIKTTLAAGPASKITVAGSAPFDANGALDLTIGGKLDVGMVNPLLEARGLHTSGALNVDATVTGSPAAPRVGGGVTLAAGSLRDYVRGVNLSDIEADLTGSEAGLQIKSFKAKAASGSVIMSGSVGILQHGMPLDLNIAAKNAQPIATSIITATLDADLHVSGLALERLDVAGKIHVNKATIGIPDSLPPEVAVLDVRRRGQGVPAQSDRPTVIGLDVAIQAPQVLVQGRGLDAALGGDIKISGTSDEPLASGGLQLQRGNFTISGNRLSFTPDSNVSFNGAGLRRRIDPTLDFTATTNVSEYLITLKITGFADTPQFALMASPDLPQDQVMSLLLFGEPAAQLSALQVAEVGYALANLTGIGGGSGNPLLKIQKALGLDRLSVGANTTTTATGATENNGAAIAAGRYVTKRVYVEGKQSNTGTSQVEVDVDLTKHLKLQTRLGNGTATTQGTTPENDPGSAVGLSYQFEY